MRPQPVDIGAQRITLPQLVDLGAERLAHDLAALKQQYNALEVEYVSLSPLCRAVLPVG